VSVVIVTETDLDVVGKYKELVSESLSGDSVYIRTKETLNEFFNDSGLTFKEKSGLIATVLGNLNNTIVTSAMQTALAWEAKNKENYLAKYELEKKIDLLIEQTRGQVNVTEQSKYEAALKQAELKKLYGLHFDIFGDLSATGVAGKLDKELLLLDQEYINKGAEKHILDSKLKETNAALHKIIADTYENYGNYTYTLTDSGVTHVNKLSTNSSLSHYQKEIAKEQAKGYAWNAWSNAAQSSASFLGVLLSSENADANSAGTLELWSNAVTKLNNIPAPTI
jgi:hypothetical protein